MKRLILIGLVGLLLAGTFALWSGGYHEETLLEKYQKLSIGMTADEIVSEIGKPDVKYPKIVGEIWEWSDQRSNRRISVYIMPGSNLHIPDTTATPELKFEFSRMAWKRLKPTNQ